MGATKGTRAAGMTNLEASIFMALKNGKSGGCRGGRQRMRGERRRRGFRVKLESRMGGGAAQLRPRDATRAPPPPCKYNPPITGPYRCASAAHREQRMSLKPNQEHFLTIFGATARPMRGAKALADARRHSNTTIKPCIAQFWRASAIEDHRPKRGPNVF